MAMDKTVIYDRILELVRDIQQGHRAANQFPDHALIIRDKLVVKLAPLCTKLEFNIVLGEMVELGMIQTGNTVNDTYVRVIEIPEYSNDNEYADQRSFSEL